MEGKIKELEELGKPIIHCKTYRCKSQDKRFFSVTYLTDKTQFSQTYACNNVEEREGILITDDFIFIKRY